MINHLITPLILDMRWLVFNSPQKFEFEMIINGAMDGLVYTDARLPTKI